MVSRVEVSWAGEFVFQGADANGHVAVFDSPRSGQGRGMTPMDALLASLGACSGMDVVALLRKRKQDVVSIKVGVSGARREYGYPKPFTAITLKYVVSGRGLSRETVDGAVKSSMEKYCSVAATVSATAAISYSCDVVEAGR